MIRSRHVQYRGKSSFHKRSSFQQADHYGKGRSLTIDLFDPPVHQAPYQLINVVRLQQIGFHDSLPIQFAD
jgi:hypothetical protein